MIAPDVNEKGSEYDNFLRCYAANTTARTRTIAVSCKVPKRMISCIVDNEKIHTMKAFLCTASTLFQILFLSKLMLCFYDEYALLYNEKYPTLNCIVIT